MRTKNLMDNPNGRPAIFSDLTGQVTFEHRLDIAETLVFLHGAHDAMKTAVDPSIHQFAQRAAVSAMCYHMGWFPYEVSAAEQYIAQAGQVTSQIAG